MKEKVHILSSKGIEWYLCSNGELWGYEGQTSKTIPTYHFWVGNPPATDDKHYDLFVAVCEFAVAQGVLRPIRMYAVVER